MKTLKTLLALPLALCALTTLTVTHAQAPALPDLMITAVQEYNTTARVLVRNASPIASGPCILRAYQKVGVGWGFLGGINVPALPGNGSVWVSISAPGIQLSPTMYFVDATNVVAEFLETNNRFIVP